MKMVEMFVDAGAAGIHIEDQINQKRCGHLDNKELIPTEQMVKKIELSINHKAYAHSTTLQNETKDELSKDFY